MAQLTSHLPQEQEDSGSNTARVVSFLGSRSNAVAFNRLNMHCLRVEKEK
jgi:hypothetical protein